MQSNIFTIFTDCQKNATSALSVVSFGSQYNSSGEFICSNGGALFANNVSTHNETTCAATAQWTRQDVIKCYTGHLL